MKIISKAYFSRIRCYSQKEQTQPLIYDSFVPSGGKRFEIFNSPKSITTVKSKEGFLF